MRSWRCEAMAITGLVVFTVAASVMAGSAAASPAGPAAAQQTTFTGKTSQARPVSLNVSAPGLKFRVGWSGKCNDGGRALLGTTFNSRLVPIHTGRFNVATSFSDRAADGVPVTYTVRLTGLIREKSASGTWRVTAIGPDTMGGHWRCETGPLTWSARSPATSATTSNTTSIRRQPLAGNSLGLQTDTNSKGRRPAPTVTLSGQVLFAQRECYQGSAQRMLPLANAKVQLNPAGANPVEANLDAQGRFHNVVVHDAQRIEAFAITDGPRVRVTPDVAGGQPYLLRLGEITQSNQVFRIGAVGNAPADYAQGAANIYGTLAEGAQVADGVSPVPIPKVNARWRYGLAGNWLGNRLSSAYDGNHTIYVGGRQFPTDGDVNGTPEPTATARDEYEQFPLLHEYGHHVLDTIAAPPADATGDHEWSGVYPNNPGLPWSEGFANAFAAIVTGKAQQTLGCTTRVNLAAEPATAGVGGGLEPMPPAPNEHLAQYNEITIAGGLWHIAARLGGGNPQAGLAPILRTLHNAPAASMRDFADALAEDGSIETTREEFEQIAEILRKQRISWAFSITAFGVGGWDGVPASSQETQVKVEGGYSCAVQNDFANNAGLLPEDRGGQPADGGEPLYELAGEGGLAYTWHDDCFGLSDGDPSSLPPGPDHFFVDFPYSGSSDPDGDNLTLSVRYTCVWDGTPDQCPPAFNADLRTFHGADPTSISTSAVEHDVQTTLQRDVWLPVIEVDGMGHCKSLLDGFDCSV